MAGLPAMRLRLRQTAASDTLTVGEYTCPYLERLGSGSFAQVYSGVSTKDVRWSVLILALSAAQRVAVAFKIVSETDLKRVYPQQFKRCVAWQPLAARP